MRAALRGGQDILYEDEIKRKAEKNSVCPTGSPTIRPVRLLLAVANSAQAANPISGASGQPFCSGLNVRYVLERGTVGPGSNARCVVSYRGLLCCNSSLRRRPVNHPDNTRKHVSEKI